VHVVDTDMADPKISDASSVPTAACGDRNCPKNCIVLYMGDEATLCQSSREDIQKTEYSFDSSCSRDDSGIGEDIIGPTAIHAIAIGDDTIRYVAVCGVCYISVGPCLSSEIFRTWHAHTLRVSPYLWRDSMVGLTSPQCRIEETPRSSRSESPPLDRWFDTPSEDEADMDAIVSAAGSGRSTPPPRSGYVPSLYLSPHPDRDLDAHSTGGSSVAISVASAVSSISSDVRSIGSLKSLSRRRKQASRKKNTMANTLMPLHDHQEEGAGTVPRFTCTFCSNASFRTVGNWTRHEEGVHLVLQKWICAPDGAKTRQGNCVYCRCGPCGTAKCEYSCRSRCAAKPVEERTFSRKDHLKQHLMAMHRAKWSPQFNRWVTDRAPPKRSRCGFCGEWFDSWAQRKKHIAVEFTDGRRMSQWRGNWGLTPDWEGKLDNAVLPETVFSPNATEDDLAILERKVADY